VIPKVNVIEGSSFGFFGNFKADGTFSSRFGIATFRRKFSVNQKVNQKKKKRKRNKSLVALGCFQPAVLKFF
jgi:hypothetical protein